MLYTVHVTKQFKYVEDSPYMTPHDDINAFMASA